MIHEHKPLLIISGPSGVGKSYLDGVLSTAGLQPVLKTTTRDMRPGEKEGVDYEFITADEYRRVRDTSDDFIVDGEFLGAYYTVRQSAIEKVWALGKIPYMYIYIGVIEDFVKAFPYSRRIYLRPTNLALIEERLKKRDGDKYPLRLAAAKKELEMLDGGKSKYYHRVILVSSNETGHIIEEIFQEAGQG